MAAACMMQDTFWSDRWRYVDAETAYQEQLAGTGGVSQCQTQSSSLVSEIAKAREQIKNSLKGEVSSSGNEACLVAQIQAVVNENKELRKVTSDLQNLVKKLESRVAALEKAGGGAASAPAAASAKPAAKPAEDDEDDDDDDVDLFASSDEEEDSEAKEKIKQERIAAYNAKKAHKTVIIAKSSVILDIKPWDDETDMAAIEKHVRGIVKDGLLWGASKLVPVGYGIKKLQMMMVIEDDKISVDELSDQITEFEDYVQSVDVAAFNKI